MISVASPIAWLDAAHAVRQFRFGPSLRVEQAGQVSGRHVRFLLHLELGIELFQPAAREFGDVEGAVLLRFGDEFHEQEEVLLPLARSQVNAEPGRIECVVVQTGVVDRLHRCADCKSNVQARVLKPVEVVGVVGEVEVLHLRGELRRETARIEMGNRVDAALRLLQRVPHGVDRIPDRRHASDAGHHHAPSHMILSLVVEGRSAPLTRPALRRLTACCDELCKHRVEGSMVA